MAVSDVYCNVVMNFNEGNTSNKTLFNVLFQSLFIDKLIDTK